MGNDILGKIGRGLGWIGVAITSLILGAGVAFIPLSLLPGPVHTDFVNGQWIKPMGVGLAGVVLIWRLAPVNRDIPFSLLAAKSFVWLAVSGFALAFWPLGLLAWFNAYNAMPSAKHDMIVLGVESTTVRPAVTSIESFRMRDVTTGWSADLEVTDERKQFAMPGRCVRILVRSGRLGLDWIDDARPITCPASDTYPAVRAP